jgi:hypothetical protein
MSSFENCNVDIIDVTKNNITDRAGIITFSKYIRNINAVQCLANLFSKIRKNKKGASVDSIFHQTLCNFALGDSRSISYFDVLAKDQGYASAIETHKSNLISSHALKRFFKSIPKPMLILFRLVLLRLFIWRLQISKPEILVLNLDAMVMNNNDAAKREGVEFTYKKINGYTPIQMTWGRFIIDAIFRSGSKHSNHEDDALKMIRRMVKCIRKKYDQNVPIVFRMDSGYFDQKLFAEMERLGVGYIVGGVFYPTVKSFINSIPDTAFKPHFGKTDEDIWEYVEFKDRRDSWKKDEYRRAIFYRHLLEEKQLLLPGCRPGTSIYTNLGMGQIVDTQLEQAGFIHLTKPEAIIHAYQQRGTDELVHRSLKEFGYEQLPFQKFTPNAAVYFIMLIAFFLFESFKEDVSAPVIPIGATPTTLRRKLIDIAGHFIKHSEKIILKVTATVMRELNFKELWERCLKAPPMTWA